MHPRIPSASGHPGHAAGSWSPCCPPALPVPLHRAALQQAHPSLYWCLGLFLPRCGPAVERGSPLGRCLPEGPPQTPFSPPYLLKTSFLLAQIAEDGGQLQSLLTAGVVRVFRVLVPCGWGTQNLGHPAEPTAGEGTPPANPAPTQPEKSLKQREGALGWGHPFAAERWGEVPEHPLVAQRGTLGWKPHLGFLGLQPGGAGGCPRAK